MQMCTSSNRIIICSITVFIYTCTLNGGLQFCWKVCRCVILAFDDIIAFIQSLENSEGVADAVEGSEIFGQQFSCWRSRGAADQSCQLFHQLLLLLLHIHLTFEDKIKSRGLLLMTSYQISYARIWIVTLFAATSTLSKNRSHSKMKTGLFASVICARASSLSSRLWASSMVRTVEHRAVQPRLCYIKGKYHDIKCPFCHICLFLQLDWLTSR